MRSVSCHQDYQRFTPNFSFVIFSESNIADLTLCGSTSVSTPFTRTFTFPILAHRQVYFDLTSLILILQYQFVFSSGYGNAISVPNVHFHYTLMFSIMFQLSTSCAEHYWRLKIYRRWKIS